MGTPTQKGRSQPGHEARALVFSIKPQWVDCILMGEKTYELRRRPPSLANPTKALLYETSPACSLRGVCTMGPVLTDYPERLWAKVAFGACVTREEFYSYFHGLTHAHAIVIKNACELTYPLELADLRQMIGFRPPQSWSWAPKKLLNAAEVAE
jgi:predicted transcriptional regulator